jgi:hypothetical protein
MAASLGEAPAREESTPQPVSESVEALRSLRTHAYPQLQPIELSESLSLTAALVRFVPPQPQEGQARRPHEEAVPSISTTQETSSQRSKPNAGAAPVSLR